MKRRLKYSRAAVIDLAKAKVYTRRTWGEAQARTYVASLIADIKALCTSALQYPSVDAVLPGLRRRRSGMHHIYYLVFDDRIEIVRVLHVASDFERWV